MNRESLISRIDRTGILCSVIVPARGSHRQPLPSDLFHALQFRPTAAAELDRTPPSTRRIRFKCLEQGPQA